MALPSIGGMLIAVMTMFLVPVLYCLREETSLRFSVQGGDASDNSSELAVVRREH
jgi:Cu(I)/Ag(I) efflux system membrane protein CusA/SilA